MNVQSRISRLVGKGWTLAAVADELGVTPLTVQRWRAGKGNPHNAKAVLAMLGKLLKRKRIPKRRRYAKSSRVEVMESGTSNNRNGCSQCHEPLMKIEFSTHYVLLCANGRCLLFRQPQGYQEKLTEELAKMRRRKGEYASP